MSYFSNYDSAKKTEKPLHRTAKTKKGKNKSPDAPPKAPKSDKKMKTVKPLIFDKTPQDEKSKKDSIDFNDLDYENLTPVQIQKLMDQMNQIDP